jgi:uncharacterized protein (DUF362 family)
MPQKKENLGESVGAPVEDFRARSTRREALVRLAQLGGALGAAGLVYNYAFSAAGYEGTRPEGPRQVRDYRLLGGGVKSEADLPQMAIAKSSKVPEELTQRAILALGGMARFISRGDFVAVKPNIGWDRMPVHAANTNPRVVAEVVRLCFEAGAKQVVVTDASCNEAHRSFQRSGIWNATHALGAKVILPSEHRFRTMRLRGDLLDEWPVYTPLIEADKLINVPVAKHHNLSNYTGAMKNWYGVLGGRRNRLHQNIHLSIADLATFMRPTLTVLDATRVLLRNGPQGGNIADARDMHQVIASLDEVAVDTYGARLIGVDPARVQYLALGQERGLGSSTLTRVVEV